MKNILYTSAFFLSMCLLASCGKDKDAPVPRSEYSSAINGSWHLFYISHQDYMPNGQVLGTPRIENYKTGALTETFYTSLNWSATNPDSSYTGVYQINQDSLIVSKLAPGRPERYSYRIDSLSSKRLVVRYLTGSNSGIKTLRIVKYKK